MEMTQHISQLIREPSPHDHAQLCQFLACTCLPREGGGRERETGAERDRQGKIRWGERGGRHKNGQQEKEEVRDIVGFNEGGTKQHCTEMEFLDINLTKDSSLLLHNTMLSAGGIDKMTYSTLWF